MIRLETVILMLIVMGILLMILLLQIRSLKKQIHHIVKEVTDYLNYITTEEIPAEPEKSQTRMVGKKRGNPINQDEQQTRLIQSVLQEYFP